MWLQVEFCVTLLLKEAIWIEFKCQQKSANLYSHGYNHNSSFLGPIKVLSPVGLLFIISSPHSHSSFFVFGQIEFFILSSYLLWRSHSRQVITVRCCRISTHISPQTYPSSSFFSVSWQINKWWRKVGIRQRRWWVVVDIQVCKLVRLPWRTLRSTRQIHK